MRSLGKTLLGIAVMGLVSMGAMGASHGAVANRNYVAGKYELSIDGTASGFLTHLAGGSPYAAVVSEPTAADGVPKKHLGPLKYEPLSFRCGTGMSRSFYTWLKDTLEHRYTRKSGTVSLLDYNSAEVSKLSFVNGLIAEIGFPALDAASKDVASLTVTLAPDTTRRTQGSSGAVATHETTAVQKRWPASSFRLAIDGLAATKVSKIEPLVFKQQLSDSATGELRDYTTTPGHLVMPNLVVTLPESDALTWYTWLQDFVVSGNNGDDKERSGTLDYLGADLKTVYFSLAFKHIGIYKMTSADDDTSGGTAIRRVKAELYFEDVVFTPGASASF